MIHLLGIPVVQWAGFFQKHDGKKGYSKITTNPYPTVDGFY